MQNDKLFTLWPFAKCKIKKTVKTKKKLNKIKIE